MLNESATLRFRDQHTASEVFGCKFRRHAPGKLRDRRSDQRQQSLRAVLASFGLGAVPYGHTRDHAQVMRNPSVPGCRTCFHVAWAPPERRQAAAPCICSLGAQSNRTFAQKIVVPDRRCGTRRHSGHANRWVKHRFAHSSRGILSTSGIGLRGGNSPDRVGPSAVSKSPLLIGKPEHPGAPSCHRRIET